MNTNKKLVSAFLMPPSFLVYPSLVRAGKVLEEITLKDGKLSVQESLVIGETSIKVHDILGVKFPQLSYEHILTIFQEWVKSGVANQVCIANVHSVITALTDKQLRSICNNALTTMDGQPLVLSLIHI